MAAIRRVSPEVAILILMPLMMAGVNVGWLYTAIGWLDPWYNVAFFIRYDDPSFLNDSYKIARLSWIIPGFILYQVFNPIVANFVLHVGVLLVSTLFFFFTVARLFDRQIAFLAAAALTVYVPFHGSGGWDYQTAPSGAYYLVAFYLVTTAALDDRRLLRMLAAGAAYACAGHADPRFINFLPVLILHFTVLLHGSGTRARAIDFIKVGSVFVLGAALITILLGLINYSIGRDFVFFRILLNIVLRYTADPQTMAGWWVPWSAFLNLRAYSYLIFPFVIFAVSVAALAVAAFRSRDRNAIAVSLLAQYVLVFSLWVIWQGLGHVALQPNYFAYPLIPAAFFAFAGLASIARAANVRLTESVWFGLLVAAILVAPLSVSFINQPLAARTGSDIGLAVIALALLAAGAFIAARGRRAILAVGVLAFAMMNFYVAVTTSAAAHYRAPGRCYSPGEAYQALVRGDRFLAAFVPGVRRFAMWWDRNETVRDQSGCSLVLAQYAPSLTSFGTTHLAPPWQGMPSAEDLPEASIAHATDSQNRIAVPTADPGNVDRLIARFQRSSVKLVVDGKTIIRVGGLSFTLYVLKPLP